MPNPTSFYHACKCSENVERKSTEFGDKAANKIQKNNILLSILMEMDQKLQKS